MKKGHVFLLRHVDRPCKKIALEKTRWDKSMKPGGHDSCADYSANPSIANVRRSCVSCFFLFFASRGSGSRPLLSLDIQARLASVLFFASDPDRKPRCGKGGRESSGWANRHMRHRSSDHGRVSFFSPTQPRSLRPLHHCEALIFTTNGGGGRLAR